MAEDNDFVALLYIFRRKPGSGGDLPGLDRMKDVVCGAVEDLLKGQTGDVRIVEWGSTVVLPPPVPEALFRVRITVAVLRVREKPGVLDGSAIVREVKRGDILPVYDQASNGWLRISPLGGGPEWISGKTTYAERVL